MPVDTSRTAIGPAIGEHNRRPAVRRCRRRINEPDFARPCRLSSWPVGRPFRQADWSRAKQDLLAQLLGDEYPAAGLTDSRAEIDTETRAARLSVAYDTGPPYRFGAIEIDGLKRYLPELVARYNDSVRPGEPYSEDKLAQLQRTLQATPYFSSVRVDIDRQANPGADGSVSAPVRLRVREAAPYRLGFGIGASSNTGARVETNFRSADLFHRAWLLNGALRLEEKKQSVFADVFLPPNQERYRNSFGTPCSKAPTSPACAPSAS